MVTKLTVAIILKWTEMWKHYTVLQQVTQCCRPAYLKEQTHALKKRSDLWLPEARTGDRETG